MFERYTERARRVVFFARYESSQAGSRIIETEHLLLGLIREDKNLMDRLMQNPTLIRELIESRMPIGEKIPTSIDLPLSDECKRILAHASQEAQELNHRHIGTEHLLLGILHEVKSTAGEILHERGLRLEVVREELRTYVSENPPSRSAMFANIATLMDEAASQATLLGHPSVGAGHLLLGMLKIAPWARFFEQHGITAESILKEMPIQPDKDS